MATRSTKIDNQLIASILKALHRFGNLPLGRHALVERKDLRLMGQELRQLYYYSRSNEDTMMKHFFLFSLLMVGVSLGSAQPAFKQRPIEEALNSDGTLKRGIQGSFNINGYTMRTGKNGEPIFLPKMQNTASGTWDTQFGFPLPGVAGMVYALASDGQGNVYVGGYFGAAGGLSTPVNNIVRYNIATNTWSALGSGSSNGVNNEVYTLAVMGSEVYVGGRFTQAGGVSANRVARFNTNTNTWSVLGTSTSNGVNSEVRALAVTESEVYVGGNFTQAGGVSANRVARFNTNTNTWSVLGTSTSNGVGGASTSIVYALAVVGNEVFVGGRFTQAGGVTVSNVARFNTNTNTWSLLGSSLILGVNGSVNALVVMGNEVCVGGEFTQAGDANANRVARFNPATNTWSALGGSGIGVSGSVYALAVMGSEVYVGGTFSQAGGLSAINVARFNTTTNTWGALGSGTNISVIGVRALAAGSEVYVGGDFFSAGGLSANYVARFNPATNTWSAMAGRGNGVRGDSNPTVNAIAVTGSDVYVGGRFTQAGGVSANNVARFNTNTNTWSALGSGSSNGVSGDYVNALAVMGNEVYVGGYFFNAGGVSANRVARFNTNTNTWSALGSGSSNGVNSNGVYAFAVIGSEVFVGGDFTQAGGVSANYVARFNTNTNTWSALGSGSSNGVSGFSNSRVYALAVMGSELYVGGGFTFAGGMSANYVARFNTSTNTWSSLGSGSNNGMNNEVYALAVMGSEVFVGGYFGRAGGVSANGMARFNPNTNTWSALEGSANGVNDRVNALAVIGSGVLYVGGRFTQAGGLSSTYIARWSSGTTSVEHIGDDVPTTYLLSQNYPNPFNPSTTISFSIPTSEFVTLKVYDVLGREVATLVNEHVRAGSYSYNFDARNLTSGVYLYKLQAGKYSETKKMVLAK